MENSTNNQSTTIIMMRGLPGSGKSQIARVVQAQLQNHVVVLDPDGIDFSSEAYILMASQLRESGVDEKLYPYRFLRSQAHTAIENGKIVLWNQAFTHQDLLDRTIKNLTVYAHEVGKEVEIFVVEVDIEPDKALNRIQDRVMNGGHDVPQEVFNRFVREYTTFESYGYPIIRISGDDDPAKSALKIIREANLNLN